MIRAAVIALLLWLRLPSAPCPMLRDDALLPPFDDIAPGFWARIRGWTDVDAVSLHGRPPYKRRSASRAPVPLSGAHARRQARGARRGRAGAALAGVLMLGGCTIAPDTLCQHPRPRAALNDTLGTRTAQAKAAKLWDSRCTVRGWVDP